MIENIHCVAPETKILTKNGYFEIKSLVGQWVDVWNGKEFSNVQIVKTSNKSSLTKVVLSNGIELECTDEHKWYIRGDNDKSEMCLTKNLS